MHTIETKDAEGRLWRIHYNSDLSGSVFIHQASAPKPNEHAFPAEIVRALVVDALTRLARSYEAGGE